MTDERMTAAAIVAERPDMAPSGDFYLELAVTGAVVAAVTPHGRRAVAGFLKALLARAPVATGEAYEAHRAILGALRSELETAAIMEALDTPELAPADLREPATVARERQLVRDTREWAASERERLAGATHARLDDVLAVSAAEHDRAAERLDEATSRAQEVLAAPAAPEADDAIFWLQ